VARSPTSAPSAPKVCRLKVCDEPSLWGGFCDEHLRERNPAKWAQVANPRIVGREEPRLWTPPLRPLTRATSRGFEVADFAEQVLCEPLLPWQRWLAVHALELNPDGNYRFRTVLALVARQNGKTHALKVIALWRMFLDGARLVLGSAQDRAIAKESWALAAAAIEQTPELAAEMAGKPREANGEETFTLSGGARYKITASSRSAGRGLSVDLLIMDEIREQRKWDAWGALSKTTMARANGQIWAISNAGDDESIVLNHLRSAALTGADPSIFIAEWSAPDGCELNDKQAWAQANPGLGHTVSEQAIASALATDPPGVFRTEVLCQRVDTLDPAIDPAAWRDCRDPEGSLAHSRGRIMFALSVSEDNEHATLAASALLDDGRVRVEIIGAWTSDPAKGTATTQARAELRELGLAIRPAVFAFRPGTTAAVIVAELTGEDGRALGAHPEPVSGNRLAESNQGLADLVSSRRVVHPGDPLLDAHIKGAQKQVTANGWRFQRTGAGHVNAAEAAADAVHAAVTFPGAGLVYDTFRESLHVVDPVDVPHGWPRWWAIRFGYRKPAVVQFWTQSPETKQLILYRELYRTGRSADDLASDIRMAMRTRDGIEPWPRSILVDREDEGRAELERKLGRAMINAKQDFAPGFNAVNARLTPRKDGSPGLVISRSALVEPDRALMEAQRPTCTAHEFGRYAWDVSKLHGFRETPVEEDDHGVTCVRWLCMELASSAVVRMRRM
jgi:hypothetical protein